MQLHKLLFLSCASQCLGTTLYVASYAGTVTTLSLTESGGNFSLDQVDVNYDCAPNPSWLTLDVHGYLYCLNEGLNTANGSLSSYRIGSNGSLTHIQNTTTISGPVSGVIYGNPAGPRAIALAHYSGSAVSSWILGNGNFSSNQNIFFTLEKPGAVPDRQDAPHEHEAILDPTGQYLLVPDLGADLIRVFSYDSALRLKELSPIQTQAGDGPRHGAFYNPYGIACETCSTYLYVTNELASTVTSYQITYLPNGGGLEGKKVFGSSTYGEAAAPEGNAPSEIQISPDNRFVIIGNRNDSSVVVRNPDPNNTTNPTIPSDTISTFALEMDGSLNFTQLAPAFGSYPRQFVTNTVGNLVGVGLQQSSEVVILLRDVKTGLIGDAVASIKIDGQITCVVFDDVSFGSTRA